MAGIATHVYRINDGPPVICPRFASLDYVANESSVAILQDLIDQDVIDRSGHYLIVTTYTDAPPIIVHHGVRSVPREVLVVD